MCRKLIELFNFLFTKLVLVKVRTFCKKKFFDWRSGSRRNNSISCLNNSISCYKKSFGVVGKYGKYFVKEVF